MYFYIIFESAPISLFCTFERKKHWQLCK